jgi:YHS domain-containing protein
VRTRLLSRRSLAALAAACFLAACAGCVGDRPKIADGAQHARCLPCVQEGDTPCIDVRVDASTPRAEWQGVTYYFCSDECRRTFVKNPESYAVLEKH